MQNYLFGQISMMSSCDCWHQSGLYRCRQRSQTSHSFTVFYLQDELLLSAECINRPKDFMMAKKLILQGANLNPNILSDEAVELKSLLVEQ